MIRLFLNFSFLRFAVIPCGTVAALMFSMLPTQAQDAEEPEKVLGTSFTCMYWDGLPPEELFYKDGEEFLPITFHHSKRSERYKLKAAERFGLYRKLPEVKEREEPFALVGQAPITKGADRMLFLVFKNRAEPPLQARIMSVDDSIQAFPVGTFRFVNFSNLPLIVKFDKVVRGLSPGGLELMKIQVPEDGGYLPFLIGNAEGKSIYENRLFAQPQGRKMVFIAASLVADGLPEVRYLDEIVVPEEQE